MSGRFETIVKNGALIYSDDCNVVIEAHAILKDNADGRILVQLKLRSLDDKAIIACRVNMECFEPGGKKLPDDEQYLYLDLNVGHGTAFGSDKPIYMRSATTRSISPRITEITYSDGTIWHDKGTEWKELPEQQPVSIILTGDEITQYRRRIGSGDVSMMPVIQGRYFRCTCGAVNLNSDPICCSCRRNVNDVINCFNKKELKEQAGASKAQKSTKQKKIIAIFALIVLVLLGLSFIIKTPGLKIVKHAPRSSSDNGFAAVKVNDKWGYINKTGKYVIEPQFDDAYGFSDNGLASVEVNGKYGYINKTGKFVIEPQFDIANSFSDNGLAMVYVNDKWGYIDSTGIIIEPQFDFAWDFSDNGLAMVMVNGKYGYIDSTGRCVIEPQFESAGSFSDNGLAVVYVNDKWGYIDSTGKYVIEPQFDDAWDFSDNGLAMVKVNGKYGYIDSTGKSVIEPLFESAGSFSDNGLAMVKVNGKYGYIDSTGKCVIEPQFDGADGFSDNGLAAVETNDKWGYIDSTGKYVIEPQFEFADSDGRVKVNIDGKEEVLHIEIKQMNLWQHLFEKA